MIHETTKKEVIIALDFAGESDAWDFLDKFGEERPYVKVGMELFYGAGPGLVARLKARGHRVFLDLKLHDIPNTVEKAMTVLAGLGADMVNVHAAGGAAMMEAAARGVRSGTPAGAQRPRVLAVTQLTSTGAEALRDEMLIGASMEEVVASYAALAKASGLDGVVASPLEVPEIHRRLGEGFLTVTPGIRNTAENPAGKQDQVRTASPREAGRLGSDFIVVGRPITRAQDPLTAYQAVGREFEEGEHHE